MDLRGRAIPVVPQEIEKLLRLHSLDLSYNYLSTISFDVSQLSSLRSLRLSNNLMTSLPWRLVSALPRFSELTELDVSWNKLWYLEKMPDSVASTLTHLDISHNEFVQLPPHISELVNLKLLNISHNKLTNGSFSSSPPSSSWLVRLLALFMLSLSLSLLFALLSLFACLCA